jgi:hypothetical protein
MNRTGPFDVFNDGGSFRRPRLAAFADLRADSSTPSRRLAVRIEDDEAVRQVRLRNEDARAFAEGLIESCDAIDAVTDAAEPVRATLHPSTTMCESCGLLIAAGSEVAVFPERERTVVMHWDACPAEVSNG